MVWAIHGLQIFHAALHCGKDWGKIVGWLVRPPHITRQIIVLALKLVGKETLMVMGVSGFRRPPVAPVAALGMIATKSLI